MSFVPEIPTDNRAAPWSWTVRDQDRFPEIVPLGQFMDMSSANHLTLVTAVESERHRYYVSAMPILRYHLRGGTQVNPTTCAWLHEEIKRGYGFNQARNASSFAAINRWENMTTPQFSDICNKLATLYWGSDSPWDISVEKQADNESFAEYVGNRRPQCKGSGLCVWFENDISDNEYNPKTGILEKGLAPATDQDYNFAGSSGLIPERPPAVDNVGQYPTTWDEVWSSYPFAASGKPRDVTVPVNANLIPLVCQCPPTRDIKTIFGRSWLAWEAPFRSQETMRFVHLTNMVSNTRYRGMYPSARNTADNPNVDFDWAWRYNSGAYTDYHWQPTVLWPLCPSFWNGTLDENANGNNGVSFRLHWSDPRLSHPCFKTDVYSTLVGFAIMFQKIPEHGNTILDRANLREFNDTSGWHPNPGESFDPDPHNTDGLSLAPIPTAATGGKRGVRFPFPWSPWRPWDDFGSALKHLGPFLQDTYASYTNLSRIAYFLPGGVSFSFASYVLLASAAELLKRADSFEYPLPAWEVNRRPKMFDPAYVITKFKSNFKVLVRGKYGTQWMSDMTWNPIVPSPYWESIFGSDNESHSIKSDWTRFLWDMGAQKQGDARLRPEPASVYDFWTAQPTQIVYMPCSHPRNLLRPDGFSVDTPGESLPFQNQ